MHPADYETIPDASYWRGLSRQRIALLAKQGRIPGAFFLGRQWFIPKGWVHRLMSENERSMSALRDCLTRPPKKTKPPK